MFEKLNQLVKENSKSEIFLHAGMPSNAIDGAITEASGVIIDVLKAQLDNGKAKDLMSFFRGKKAEQDLLLKMMVNKYANRLNKYHAVNTASAKEIAENIIPTVLAKFVLQTIGDKKEEKGIFAFLNSLSGYSVNFEEFFLKINHLQMA